MKLLHKRILILFSIALNVGFVIMTVTMAYQHHKPFHKRSWLEIVDTVHRLNLPESQENDVIHIIKDFRHNFDQHHAAIKQGRKAIMQLLATTGPLDQAKLHQLLQASEDIEKRKNKVFEAHVVELRNRLGDENGALFFSFLLKQLESDKKSAHK